ncbi:MAG: FG-GAP repeat domain-containing protein [Planctomycetota bacterium]
MKIRTLLVSHSHRGSVADLPVRLASSMALSLALAGSAAAQSFHEALPYATGESPASVAAGDLNGDGHPDLVVGIRFGLLGLTQIMIYDNDGTGRFNSPALVLDVPGSGEDLLVEDLNGDEIADLIVGIETPPAIAIYEGLGFGALADPLLLPVPVNVPVVFVKRVLIGDVNGDGHKDLIACNSASNADQEMSLFLADGFGGFLTPVEIAEGLDAASGALLADLNGDGRLDYVLRFAMAFGDGAGGFGPAVPAPFSAGSNALATLDLNGDGHLDLASISASGAQPRPLQTALGNGAGGFAAPVNWPVAEYAQELCVADYDGDGRLDIALIHAITTAHSKLTILHGDGVGGLIAPLVVLSGYQAQSWDLTTADFDGDQRPDLAWPNKADDEVLVLRHKGSSLAFDAGLHANGTSWLRKVAVADLDGDGLLDAVMTRGHETGAEEHIVRWLGDGSGGLHSLVGYYAGGKQEGLALGHLNGDGLLDVVATMPELDLVAVHLGSGGGHFSAAVHSPVGSAPAALALADFNGDALLDVVTVNEGSDDLSLLLGDGQGALGAAVSLTCGGLQPNDLLAADFNEDGLLDLAVANRASEDVAVMLGDGIGGFGPPLLLAAGTAEIDCAPDGLGTGDVNGDGHRDLVVGGASEQSPGHGALTVLLGDGEGGFAALPPINAEATIEQVLVADLNGDGLSDLAAVSNGFDVYLGYGTGAFEPPLDYHVPASFAGTLADMNGDGRLDLVGTSSHPDTWNATVRLNASQPHVWHDLGHGLAGSFGLPVLVGTGPLTDGSAGTLRLHHANPNKLCVLFIAPSSTPASFKGGMLVPVPPLISFLLITSPQGQVPLSWPTWTPGVPGSSWYFQYAVVDAAGPAGASLSNALRAKQP